MSTLSKGYRRRIDLCALAVLFLGIAIATPARADTDTVTINVDEAQIMTLPDRVATIVIGNPLIADATLQNGGILVVTGKGYGATNLLALDRGGRVLMEKTIQVTGPGTKDLVVVYRGVERESYSCAPTCQRRITLGDSPAYFNATLTQSGTRNGQAQTAVPGR
ncbi:MAG TPA: pilus assembly protein N-terminal domain-containing protein [Pseudolabrys sp.]|jgi:putative type II/III system pilus formation protein|nr:pilus assembly protein N-terminal domain-containing protein [Pseudolabrys sp.]